MKHVTAYNCNVLSIFSIVAAFFLVCALCLPVQSAEYNDKPTVIVFDVNADENVDSTYISTATTAIRDYLRQSGKVEATLFDKNSPIVARAVMEHKISPDKTVNYEDRSTRAEVALALGIGYACGAYIKVDNLKVRLSMWIVNAEKPKKKWEVTDYVAEAGRMDETGMRNAIHSICSGAVNEIVQMAFADIMASLPEPTVAAVIESIPEQPAISTFNADDLANSADINLKQGNTARAVDLYQKAINANPSDHGLRIKLAEVYHKRGMDQEANEELDRAIAIGAEKDIIDSARRRIFSNSDSVTALEKSADQTNIRPERKSTVQSQADAATKVSNSISKGDELWNAGDAKGAETVYLQAIAQNPSDWQAYERLAILQAAQFRFEDSRQVLKSLNEVQAAPPENILRARYAWLSRVLDFGVRELLAEMESDIDNFEAHKMTREAAYESIKLSKDQIQSLILYADDLVYPPEMRQANANRVQACRLGLQAASGLMEYLETNLVKYKSNASIFMEQANVELADTASAEER